MAAGLSAPTGDQSKTSKLTCVTYLVPGKYKGKLQTAWILEFCATFFAALCKIKMSSDLQDNYCRHLLSLESITYRVLLKKMEQKRRHLHFGRVDNTISNRSAKVKTGSSSKQQQQPIEQAIDQSASRLSHVTGTAVVQSTTVCAAAADGTRASTHAP